MVWPEGGQQRGSAQFTSHVLLIAAAFFVPVAMPSLFGWLNGLLAVPVFLLLTLEADERTAVRKLRNGILIASVGALILNQALLIIFALSFLPLGYSIYRSGKRREDPTKTAAHGILVLGLTWFVFWTVYGILAGINPYTSLLAMLDESFGRIIEIYRNNADLSADVLYTLEQIVTEIRTYVPKILPGLLAGSVIITVWLNLVVSNALMLRLRPDQALWPQYSRWKLPERLVWTVIAGGVLAVVGHGVLKNTGYCLVIVSAILYFFQGLAVFIHLLDKWKVPGYLRIVLYVIVAVQSYGILLLSVLGLADIWFDFRKSNTDEQPNN